MRRLILLLLAIAILDLPLVAASTKTPAKRASKSLTRTGTKQKVHRAKARRSRVNVKARRARVNVKARRARVRRVRIPYSPVKGSRESLLRQNERTEELERIEDEEQLFELTQSGQLVELPASDYAEPAGNLPRERRYCRPWTRTFLEDFGRDYYEEFRQPLIVTSAVRTVAVQKKLRRRNHNAADIDGDLASPHLTGATIDIGKRGMTKKQLTWMRDYLLEQQNRGMIDVAEEFRQRVFHITVYKDYEVTKAADADASPVAPAAEDAAPAVAPALATSPAPAATPADEPR